MKINQKIQKNYNITIIYIIAYLLIISNTYKYYLTNLI